MLPRPIGFGTGDIVSQSPTVAQEWTDRIAERLAAERERSFEAVTPRVPTAEQRYAPGSTNPLLAKLSPLEAPIWPPDQSGAPSNPCCAVCAPAMVGTKRLAAASNPIPIPHIR